MSQLEIFWKTIKMVFLSKINFKDKPYLLFLVLSFFALLLRFLIAFQDIAYLDRLFIPDDTYYILSISRSIAEGLGPTTDGIHLTSGFQPLVCFLLVPIFCLGFDNDGALVFSIYLSAFWGGLSTFILASFLKQINSTRSAIIGSLLWIFCPIILKNDLNGMETSLAGFLGLLTLLSVVLVDKKTNTFRLFSLGLICGLTFLARVDSCFLLIVVGFFGLLHWGIKRTVFFVFIALMVALPWWIYAWVTFGTIVPESGEAVRQFLMLSQKTQGTLSLVSFYALIEWFPVFRETALSAFLGMILTFYLMGKSYQQARKYGCLILFPFLLQLAFYTLYLPAFWYLTRYYYFIFALIIISFALVTDNFIADKKQKKIGVFCVLAIMLSLYGSYIVAYFAKPAKTPFADIGSLKGYREIAIELNNHFSPGDVVGAFQSGALGYYASKSVRVINLDGVVNRAAGKALASRNMKAYVDSEGMNRFADWEYSSYLFRELYGADFPSGCFNTIYRAKKQGSQNFILRNYRKHC